MPERPYLTDYIDDPLIKAEIQQRFPPAFLRPYEESLDREKRWGEGAKNYNISQFAKKPGFSESVLEHTCSMLSMLWEFKRLPNFSAEINFRTTTYMIGGHDSPEPYTHDAPSCGDDRFSPYWIRRKEAEHKIALGRIISRIPDLQVRVEMADYYHRYIAQEPSDKEALLARFIDKAQGTTRVGVDNVFNYRAVGLEQPPVGLAEHIRNSLAILNGATLSLVRAVSTPAQVELLNFAYQEVNRFKSIGFEDLAQEAQRNLGWVK